MSDHALALDRREDALPEPHGIGAWMFRNRSWLPVPLGLVVAVLSQRRDPAPVAFVAGLIVALAGESLRLWAVRHIGTVSRTRSTRMGPFITTGPFAFVRNPLYVGNWCLWTGVVISSSVYWMLPIVWVAFMAQYGHIVAWEERLMRARYPHYREYEQRVPRWLPRLTAGDVPPFMRGRTYRWSDVLFSERGTLMALVAMMAVLVIGCNRLGRLDARAAAPPSERSLRDTRAPS
jgi:protein-S-isoprenylcysteine O-methyltransferase Ste14